MVDLGCHSCLLTVNAALYDNTTCSHSVATVVNLGKSRSDQLDSHSQCERTFKPEIEEKSISENENGWENEENYVEIFKCQNC